jgi:hypothetical protein
MLADLFVIVVCLAIAGGIMIESLCRPRNR